MTDYFVVSIVSVFVLLLIELYLAFNGSSTAKVFLWTWAIGLSIATTIVHVWYPSSIKQLPVASLIAGSVMLYLLRYWGTNDIEVAHQETRRLLTEMNSRIDSERKYLAGRLHDDVNHKLLEAKMFLRRLRPILEANIRDPEAARSAQMIVMSVQDLVYETYVECRDIIKNTRVEVIESIGLIAALTDMVSQYKSVLQQPRLVFDHNLTAGTAPSGEAAVTVYRILQEAVLNVVKHAKATNARIRFYYREKTNDYVIEVKDDGVGFKPSSVSGGIGMIDMRERAISLGGDLHVYSDPKKGCRIRLRFKARKPTGNTIAAIVGDRRNSKSKDRRQAVAPSTMSR